VTQPASEIEAKAEEVAAPAFEQEAPAAQAGTNDWSDQLPAAPAIDLGSTFNTEPRSFGESIPQFGSTSYHFASNESASGQDNFAAAEKEEFAAVESPSELVVSPADAARDESEHEPTEPLYVSEQVPAPVSEVAQPEPVAVEEPVPAFADSAESKEGLLDPAPSFFAASESVATVEEDYTERIPTLPPTSRESLSDIPFLVPPASRETHATNGHSDHASNGSSDQVVDDVVRKVLEKLQPQLQEMLSQGMKPLLESLVQNELQKK
jgi:hypothetical protein